MKVLWVAQRDPKNPRAGGVGRTIQELCSRLAMKGHQITVLTGGWKGCSVSEVVNGFKIIRYGQTLGPHFALPVFLLKQNFDLVVNDLGHAVPWVSSSLLARKNIVFFHHLHARTLNGQVNPVLAKIIIAIEKCYFIPYGRSTFVTESPSALNDLRSLGIDAKNIEKIPPGVDKDVFHPAIKTKFPSMVYFGGMRRYKRPEEGIHLLNNLIDRIRDLKMVVVGSGPELQSLVTLSKKLNLQKNIKFTGHVSTIHLAEIVASSWLNIHTSVAEGWGFSILEASAAGTPTVAYDVPGVTDAIEQGLNGIKVEDGNRRGLADAALSILSDPERWWSSSTVVAEKYSWDNTAELWDALIRKVGSDQIAPH